MSRDTDRDFGVVRRWDSFRGFGFITPDGGTPGRDVFCHIKATRTNRALEVGTRVSFYTIPDRRNPAKIMADDVVVMK